jgi:pyridoxine 4-dehydrogenase
MPAEQVQRTIRLGDADVVRIGLGTNRLRHTPEHVAFIRDVAAAGLQHIDTAHLYTGGESERAIGDALPAAGDGMVVATKGGYRPGEGAEAVLRGQIEQSLRSLQTEAIELYYLHRVHPGTPLAESLGTIRDYVDRGAIRHVGISEVTVEQLEQARAIVPIAAVQNEYNVAQRGHDAVVDHCEREGIVFVPFYPLSGDGGAALRAVAARHGATESQAALAWLLHRSPAILPIPGTLSPAHARENLAALDIALSAADLDALH